MVLSDVRIQSADGRLATQEAGTAVIELPDESPAAVKSMLSALYTGDYATTDTLMQFGSDFTHHAVVYALGDKYDIQAVKDLAFAKYAKEFEKTKSAYYDYDDLVSSLSFIYLSTSPTDRRLRESIVACFQRCIHIDAWEAAIKHKFFSMLREIPDLSVDLAKAYVSMRNDVDFHPQCVGGS